MVGQQYFCYLYIEQAGQAFVAFGLTIIVFGFMIKTWRQFIQARQAGKINNTIQTTYIIILALCLLYMPQIIVSETFFWLSKTEQPPINSTAQFISKYIFFMEFLEEILFETILLLISYNWLNNIISIFDYVKEEFRKQIMLFRFIKVLIWVRIGDFVLGALFIFSGEVDDLNNIAKMILTAFILQETLITITFFTFISLIRKNKRVISQVQKTGIIKMIKTYACLIILTIINILWNIWYLVDLITKPQQFKHLQCKISDIQWDAYDMLQMVMMIGLNLFAAFIVLVLYRVNQKVHSSFIYDGSYTSSKINLSSEISGDLMKQ